jgi:serine/threonine protein kinase
VIGQHLGPYHIVAKLGEGGMGEVYRARDTRLDRTVAIKILPAQFASDVTLRERFDREARVISSLSHPHICALFDVGQQDGIAFLVIEHLEGETLAARLQKGAFKIDLALQIAIQLAGALEAAHRAGVVHRDVKPGNVMLTRAGAKLLDFGLAKGARGDLFAGATGTEPQDPAYAASLMATTPAAVTTLGTILGTLQYMSPEQLDGAEADSRSDIFAFGALAYEMVTGRKAFEGKSQASLIASIMSADPPAMAELQPATPASLDRVVRKCLAKAPDDRWQSAKDLKDELSWIANAGSTSDVDLGRRAELVIARSSRERLAWGVAAVLATALVITALMGRAGFLSPAPESALYRSSLIMPPGTTSSGAALGRSIAISPNGRRIVFIALDKDRRRQLWVRELDSDVAKPLPGTEGGNTPFWSPDSRSVGFVAQGQLKAIDLSGGPPVTLAREAVATGGSWNSNGVILFSPRGRELYQVSAAGGTPAPATTPPEGVIELHSDPFFLPDGRRFLYQVTALTPTGDAGGIFVGTLDGKEAPKRLLTVHSNAAYARGYLLFTRERVLLAQPFDATRLTVSGTTTALAEAVEQGSSPVAANFSVSETGAIVLRAGTSEIRTRLTWFNRDGSRAAVVGEVADQLGVEMTPDGRRVVVSGLDQARNTRDLWTYDLERQGLRTRFTFDTADDMGPIWSPDGRLIWFSSRRSGRLDIFQKQASGIGAETQFLTDNQNNLYPSSVSSDGRLLLYFTGNALSRTGNDLFVIELDGEKKATPFMQTEFNETYAQFSPDMRWVSYTSNESGRSEVYVAPFPGQGGKWQVSTAGGSYARWRGDGKEIFFESIDGPLMAAAVDGSSSVVVGAVRELFNPRMRTVGFGGSTAFNYAVSRDGQRFLVNATEEGEVEAPITLLVNWAEALR